MNKTQTLIATATLVTGLGAVTTVSAEEQVKPKTSVSEATKPVTKADVDQARLTLETAQSEATKQKEVVADQTVKVETAESTVQSLTEEVKVAEELVEKATPEEIAKAEGAITTAENTLAEETDKVAPAESDVAEASQAVSDQEAVVDEAQKQVDQAQVEVDEAQKQVDQAQAILDGTGQAEILAEAEGAQAQFESATKAEKTAQENLTSAIEADKKRQEAIDQAKEALKTAEADLTSAQTVFDQATVKANETQLAEDTAQADVNKAQSVVDGLTDEIANRNEIKLPEGYLTALKAFYLNQGSSEDLTSIGQSALANHTYRSNSKDKAVVISDVNNLTVEQRQELTLYAVDLLNQIRNQAGSNLVLANESAIEFADKVANGSTTLGHDTKVIPEVAKELGLFSMAGVNHYENFSSGYFNPSKIVTMDTLKGAVYNTLVSMLFKDAPSNWGHTTSLVGVRYLKSQPDSRYIGIDVSNLLYQTGSGNLSLGRIHILGVADRQIEAGAKFDKTANLAQRDLQAELSSAEVKLNQAETVLANAQEVNKTAQTDKNSAQIRLNESKIKQAGALDTLSKAEAVEIKIPGAQEALGKAQDDLIKSKERLTLAEEAVALLTADVKAKQANLEATKSVLVDKETVLKQAQDRLSKEQNTLRMLNQELTEAQRALKAQETKVAEAETKLTEAKAYLESLLKAPEILAEKQALLTEAKEMLIQAQQALDLEKAKLNQLQEKEILAQSTLTNLEKSYEIELAKDAPAHAVPLVSTSGQVIGYTNTTKSTAIQTKKVAVTLPKTGEVSSASLTGFGLILSALTLLGLKRKEGN